MKGQLSIEYLLLFFTALFIFGIAITGMLYLQELSELYTTKVSFAKNAQRLLMRVEEVCVLGNGNSREVLLTHPVNVGTSILPGQRVEVTWGNLTVGKDIPCSVVGTDDLQGLVVVKNENGIITFEMP